MESAEASAEATRCLIEGADVVFRNFGIGRELLDVFRREPTQLAMQKLRRLIFQLVESGKLRRNEVEQIFNIAEERWHDAAEDAVPGADRIIATYWNVTRAVLWSGGDDDSDDVDLA